MNSLTDPMPETEGWYLVELNPMCHPRWVQGRPFGVYYCKPLTVGDGSWRMQWVGIIDMNVIAWHELPQTTMDDASDVKRAR